MNVSVLNKKNNIYETEQIIQNIKNRKLKQVHFCFIQDLPKFEDY